MDDAAVLLLKQGEMVELTWEDAHRLVALRNVAPPVHGGNDGHNSRISDDEDGDNGDNHDGDERNGSDGSHNGSDNGDNNDAEATAAAQAVAAAAAQAAAAAAAQAAQAAAAQAAAAATQAAAAQAVAAAAEGGNYDTAHHTFVFVGSGWTPVEVSITSDVTLNATTELTIETFKHIDDETRAVAALRNIGTTLRSIPGIVASVVRKCDDECAFCRSAIAHIHKSNVDGMRVFAACLDRGVETPPPLHHHIEMPRHDGTVHDLFQQIGHSNLDTPTKIRYKCQIVLTVGRILQRMGELSWYHGNVTPPQCVYYQREHFGADTIQLTKVFRNAKPLSHVVIKIASMSAAFPATDTRHMVTGFLNPMLTEEYDVCDHRTNTFGIIVMLLHALLDVPGVEAVFNLTNATDHGTHAATHLTRILQRWYQAKGSTPEVEGKRLIARHWPAWVPPPTIELKPELIHPNDSTASLCDALQRM